MVSLLTVAVAAATIATPVIVPILWRHLEKDEPSPERRTDRWWLAAKCPPLLSISSR